MADDLGARLTTQNMLLSASAAMTGGSGDWDSIHNLSVLVDLFCLYDRIIVLGAPSPRLDANRSPIMALIETSGMLHVESPAAVPQEAVEAAMRAHVFTYGSPSRRSGAAAPPHP